MKTTQSPVPAIDAALAVPTAARRGVSVRLALFITGFGTFLPVFATQPLLPLFRQIFNASELQVSLTVSGPVLAVAIMAPLVGMMADAVGRKRVIVTSMLGLALPTALAAMAATLDQFIVWRFLQGIFVPGIITVAIAYVSEESPHGSVGATMAVYVTGTVVGGFAGRFITGVAATHWGWRAAFLMLAALTALSALLIWRFLPRATKFVRQNKASAVLRSMGMHLRNPQLLATYAVAFTVMFCLVGTFTYVNFYLADAPFFLGPAALAGVFAVYLIGAVITPTAGSILDRIGYRRGLMGAVAISATGMLLTLVHWVPAVIAGLTLEASGVFASQSAGTSHVGLAADGARSSAAGLYVTFYYLGGFTGSVLPGLFWQQAGWFGCVVIILCMQCISVLVAKKLWIR